MTTNSGVIGFGANSAVAGGLGAGGAGAGQSGSGVVAP
jgi:hypothetical protein